MIQIRYKMFETNSSSACSLCISIVQVENIEIPHRVDIDTNCNTWDNTIGSRYLIAKKNGTEQDFLDLLANVGVKDIYLDGKLVSGNPENHTYRTTNDKINLAICFGEYMSFCEYTSWGGEIDDYNPPISLANIKKIQTYAKNPDYMIYCTDGEYGNELDWYSLEYSKRHITEEDIEKDEKYRKLRSAYECQRLDEENERLEQQIKEYYEENIRAEEDAKFESPYDDVTDFYKNKYNKKARKKKY